MSSNLLEYVEIIESTITNSNIYKSDINIDNGNFIDVQNGIIKLADDQISGDKINGGTINEITVDTIIINNGKIQNCLLQDNNIILGYGKTIDVSKGKIILADGQINGSKISGGIINNTNINNGKLTECDIALKEKTQFDVSKCSFIVGDKQINGNKIAYGTLDSSSIIINKNKILDVSQGKLILGNQQINGDSINNGKIETIEIENLTANNTKINKLFVEDININKGNIDNSSIGLQNPSSGKFSELNVDRICIDDNIISTKNLSGDIILKAYGYGNLRLQNKTIISKNENQSFVNNSEIFIVDGDTKIIGNSTCNNIDCKNINSNGNIKCNNMAITGKNILIGDALLKIDNKKLQFSNCDIDMSQVSRFNIPTNISQTPQNGDIYYNSTKGKIFLYHDKEEIDISGDGTHIYKTYIDKLCAGSSKHIKHISDEKFNRIVQIWKNDVNITYPAYNIQLDNTHFDIINHLGEMLFTNNTFSTRTRYGDLYSEIIIKTPIDISKMIGDIYDLSFSEETKVPKGQNFESIAFKVDDDQWKYWNNSEWEQVTKIGNNKLQLIPQHAWRSLLDGHINLYFKIIIYWENSNNMYVLNQLKITYKKIDILKRKICKQSDFDVELLDENTTVITNDTPNVMDNLIVKILF